MFWNRRHLSALPERLPTLWPALEKKPVTPQLDVRPAVFWKSFLDAGTFFALWLLVALAAEYRLA